MEVSHESWAPNSRPDAAMAAPNGARSFRYDWRASTAGFESRCFLSDMASPAALAMPMPVCGRTTKAASPASAILPLTMFSVS